MTGDTTAAAKNCPLHPVYTVTNIQNKVRILDGVKVTYSSWVKLFKLHAKGYKVLHHIDGTAPPAATDPTYTSWVEIDSIVLQWIYGTLSDDLLVRILENDTTAREAWLKIQTIFLNNKSSRAAALEHEFTNLSLTACSSMDEYCQKLKDLSGQLEDVGYPVSDVRLVLQLVRGLPPEYDTTASLINHGSYSWDDARGMIDLEKQRQAVRKQPNESALVTPQNTTATQNSSPTPPQTTTQNRPYDPNFQQYRGRGRGRGRGGNRGGRSNNRGGRGRSQFHYPPPWAWWSTPPCPYPTQPVHWGTPPPFSNRPPAPSYSSSQPVANIIQPGTPASPVANQYDALNFTDIGAALQTSQLTPPDPNWYMDTGASTHVTSNSGLPDWKTPFPPQ
ncbi:hypothetical protein L2E82_13173 [Cichorium intybus]|uniref:Uncharacterized protein n=1 Tax=Cichorium intybus TaxID=13427 RepID=A0ACB9GIR9_CICIN|nr:hypothetical protein L2E82_13173 [Cichorium intybus]